MALPSACSHGLMTADAHFAAAKAGLRMVSQSMAREYGPQGLHLAHGSWMAACSGSGSRRPPEEGRAPGSRRPARCRCDCRELLDVAPPTEIGLDAGAGPAAPQESLVVDCDGGTVVDVIEGAGQIPRIDGQRQLASARAFDGAGHLLGAGAEDQHRVVETSQGSGCLRRRGSPGRRRLDGWRRR